MPGVSPNTSVTLRRWSPPLSPTTAVLFSVLGQVDTERIEIIEAALAAVGDADGSDRARLLGLLALERTFDDDYPARRALADEALSMARRSMATRPRFSTSSSAATTPSGFLRPWTSAWPKRPRPKR